MNYRHEPRKSTDENIAREQGRLVNSRADFVKQLESGELKRSSYPERLAMVTHCPDCNEICFQIIWCGELYLVHLSAELWTVHVCPDPVEDWRDSQ